MPSTKPEPLFDLDGTFGFNPGASAAHFLVNIPEGGQLPVEVSEHLSWDASRVGLSVSYGTESEDGQVRVQLARRKWNEIAEVVKADFNARLRREGARPGKWKPGYNAVSRLLGKELTLLAWGIEDADPSLIPAAVANWQGLSAEERWWLYTMTAAATGNYMLGRDRGWRKAVRYALTENPVSGSLSERPIVPEFFRMVSEAAQLELSGDNVAKPAKRPSGRGKTPRGLKASP